VFVMRRVPFDVVVRVRVDVPIGHIVHFAWQKTAT